MPLWSLLRSLPRIADTLLDLVHLSQEQNLLLRELFHAQTHTRAPTPTTRLITARRRPLNPDDAAAAASRRPPARGDQVWRQTRSTLERHLEEQSDQVTHPHRQHATSALSDAAARRRPNRDTPTPPTR